MAAVGAQLERCRVGTDVVQPHQVCCRRSECLRSPFLSKLPAEFTPLRVESSSRREGAVRTVAYAGNVSVIDHGYDLYELLGVEVDAPVREIKQAYRWLQKRCHPDVAGPIGHDMAILLNDAYATLSDALLRAHYDVKRMERAAFEGYTGKPLYSKWMGPADEDRAIFVDETQCVGCLKCALIASSTFAIENRYGRARAVGQWADSEATTYDAIRACPVDCISFVPREQLPALEFVMTKQPRAIVGVDLLTYGGRRNENVFVAAEKFLKKCAERELTKRSTVQESPAQREARMAAAENIQARAGRWWHHFVGTDPSATVTNPQSLRTSRGAIIRSTKQPSPNHSTLPTDGQLHALLEAAKRRRQGKQSKPSHATLEDDYWSPAAPCSTSVPFCHDEQQPARRHIHGLAEGIANGIAIGNVHNGNGMDDVHVDQVMNGWVKAVLSATPVAVSFMGALFAGLTTGNANSSEAVVGAAGSYSGGPLPAEVTSGVFMHMLLAAVVWYMVAAVVSGVAAFLVVSVVTMTREKKD